MCRAAGSPVNEEMGIWCDCPKSRLEDSVRFRSPSSPKRRVWYNRNNAMKQKRYPQGHFVGLGIAMGIPLGMPIGLALGNIAVGPLLGAVLGLPIGYALEVAKNPNPIAMSAKEKARKRQALVWALAVGLIICLSVLVLYMQR